MKKIIFIFAFIIAVQLNAFPQIRFSVATDISLLRNFSPQQKFWGFGQTVQGNFHFSKKETAYAWITYYSQGKFTNNFKAAERTLGTVPDAMQYSVTGKWRYRQVSLGWKHYFKGSYDEEKTWNIYGIAGFGILFTRAENNLSSTIDTTVYMLKPKPILGTDDFKRLTIDLGIGTEYPVGGNVFLYGDVRTWIPSSFYPSPLFHNKRNVPFPIIINAGIRILFDFDY